MKKDKKAATNIGVHLKQLLKMRGITQRDLSEKLHVSSSSVSDWINSKIDPTLEMTVKIANLLNVSIDLLVLGNRNVCQTTSAIENNSDEPEEIAETDDIENDIEKSLNGLLFNRKLKEEWLAFIPLLKYIDIDIDDSIKKASEITDNKKPQEITCKIRPKGYAIHQNKPLFVWDVRGSFTQLFLIKACWGLRQIQT